MLPGWRPGLLLEDALDWLRRPVLQSVCSALRSGANGPRMAVPRLWNSVRRRRYERLVGAGRQRGSMVRCPRREHGARRVGIHQVGATGVGVSGIPEAGDWSPEQ